MKLLKIIVPLIPFLNRIATPTIPESATFNELLAIWNKVQRKTRLQEINLADKLVRTIMTLEDLKRFPSDFNCNWLGSPREFAEKEVGLTDGLEALLALGRARRTCWTRELVREKISMTCSHAITTMEQFRLIFDCWLKNNVEFELGVKCVTSIRDYLTLSELLEDGCRRGITFNSLLTEAFRFKGEKIAQCEIEATNDLAELRKLYRCAPEEFRKIAKAKLLKVIGLEIFKCEKLADLEALLLYCPHDTDEAELIIDEILRLSESDDSCDSEKAKSVWTLEQLHSLFEHTGMTRLRSLVIRRRTELLQS